MKKANKFSLLDWLKPNRKEHRGMSYLRATRVAETIANRNTGLRAYVLRLPNVPHLECWAVRIGRLRPNSGLFCYTWQTAHSVAEAEQITLNMERG